MKALAASAFVLLVACDDAVAPAVVADSSEPFTAVPSPTFAELVPAGVVGTDPLPPEPVDPDGDALMAREWVIRNHSASVGAPPFEASPEAFAAAMKGTIVCGKQKCRAGREVCAVSPSPDYPPRCAPIQSWVDHRTPRPKAGFPPLGGISACDGSHNCPESSVCCLHELGDAEVQAVVCHQSVDECRDKVELCDSAAPNSCRTPGTVCREVEENGYSVGTRCVAP